MSPVRAVLAAAVLLAGMTMLALAITEGSDRTPALVATGAILLLAGAALHFRAGSGAWPARAVAAASGAVLGFGGTRALQTGPRWPYAWRAFTRPEECVSPPASGDAVITVCMSPDPVPLVLAAGAIGTILLASAVVLARRARG